MAYFGERESFFEGMAKEENKNNIEFEIAFLARNYLQEAYYFPCLLSNFPENKKKQE